MKKLLVFGLAVVLVLTMATMVMAKGSIYFDLAVSGSSTNTLDTPDLPWAVIGTNPELFGASIANMDFSGTMGFLIGGEYNFDRFKVVAEYNGYSFEHDKTTGTYQDAVPLVGGQPIDNPANSNLDYTAIVTMVKGGYRLIDKDQVRFDVVAGYLGLEAKGMEGAYKDANFTNDGPMLGFDAYYDFSEKYTLKFSYETVIDGSPDLKALDDMSPSAKSSDLTAWKIRGIYKLNEKWDISLAYSNLASKIRYTTALGKVKVDSEFSGFALGTIYNF